MSEQDFVAKYFHELLGLAVDGGVNRRGGSELSIWIKATQQRIAERLRAIYKEHVNPTERAPANGAPVSPVRRSP